MLIIALGWQTFSLVAHNVMVNVSREFASVGALARALLLALLIAAIGALVVAVHLRKRKNWARLVAIPLIAVYVVGVWVDAFWGDAIIGALWPESPLNQIKKLAADAPADIQDSFDQVVMMSIAAGVFKGIVFTALGIWSIKRLRSDAVRRELSAAPDDAA